MEVNQQRWVELRIWASRLFSVCPIKIQMSPTNMRIHLNFNNGKCGLNHQIRVSSAKLLDCASIKWWFPFSIITYIYVYIYIYILNICIYIYILYTYIYIYGVLKKVGSPETIGFNTNMVYCWIIWGYSHDLGNLPIWTFIWVRHWNWKPLQEAGWCVLVGWFQLGPSVWNNFDKKKSRRKCWIQIS